MSDEIAESVRQWRAKAESDWTAVEILLSSGDCPADAVCFHCQQFVEKLLKAILTRYQVEAPRIHDLRRLIQLAKPYAPQLLELADSSDALTIHGVETRYPDGWRQITADEMNEIVEVSRKFGEIPLAKLDE